MKVLTEKMYAEAYKYVEVWGFSVIPVGKDKRPLLASWKPYQERQPTQEELKRWWAKWPDANIGIVTGKISGITVVDVDTHKGGNPDLFPKTFAVRTGNGGLQFYYTYQEGFSVSANAYPNMPHVDIRSDGGFVVAAPSRIIPHTKEGKERKGLYEVIDAMDFQPFPAHLFLNKKSRSISELVEVSEGTRNDSIASAVGSLVYGKTKEQMKESWVAVEAINKTYRPPLSQKDLKTTFQSICKKELKRQDDFANSTPSPFQISKDEFISISLRKNNANVPFRDMANALLVLRQHPKTSGKIRYNEFKQEIEYDGKRFEDEDTLDLVFLMQSDIKLSGISKDTVFAAVQKYAQENKYDEAKEWLEALKWDGISRLEEWTVSSLGVSNTQYNKAVGLNWFCGMVRRLLQPGCIFDYVLVVVGPQGIGKTSLFRVLGGPWYKSFTGAVENKDFYLSLRGAAIIDLDEGVALYKSESIKIKSIITETHDEYRAPYDRITKKYPRRFVFSMSTNDSEPFRDTTGNRRYWVLDIKNKVNFKWLEDNRSQLFAEAVHMIKNNTPLLEVPQKEAADIQELHLPSDEWSDPIGEYLREFETYRNGNPDFNVSIYEIFDKVLKQDRMEKLDTKSQMRIGTILKKEFGLEKRRESQEGLRKYRYYLSKEKMEELSKSPLPGKEDELTKLVKEANENF